MSDRTTTSPGLNIYPPGPAVEPMYLVGDRENLIRLRDLVDSALNSDRGAAVAFFGTNGAAAHAIVACVVERRVLDSLATPAEAATDPSIPSSRLPSALPAINALVAGKAA